MYSLRFIYICCNLILITSRHVQIMNPIHIYTLKHRLTHVQLENSPLYYNKMEYLIEVQVGSRMRKFQIIIDTGSSDTWLPSVGSQGFSQLSDRQLYNCARSHTCTQTHQTIDVSYGGGDIQGDVMWDSLYLDGYKIKNQSMLLIHEAKQNMQNCPGIMGLSFQGISQNPNPTILSTMVADDIISCKMFSLYLNNRETSIIIFGAIDKKYLQDPNQDIMYAPLQNKFSYQIHIKGLMVGQQQLFPINQALVDSGTTCLTIPATIIDLMKLYIQNKYEITCVYNVESYSPSYSILTLHLQHTTMIDTLPSIYIAIDDDKVLELKPQDYIDDCVVVHKPTHQVECLTKLQRSEHDKMVILGDAFLQSYYTIFDQDNLQIGFGRSIKIK